MKASWRRREAILSLSMSPTLKTGNAGRKTVYLIGGTTEANRAAVRLEKTGYRVLVSVASPLGEAMARAGSVDAGAKDADAMAAAAGSAGAAAILDCSHPYAAKATSEAQRAAGLAGVPYLRLARPFSPAVPGAIYVDSWQEAVSILADAGAEAPPRRALLAIGTRNLRHFALAGGCRPDFAVRVLPVPESLDECHRLGVPPRDIIAACPPHSTDFNRACLRHAGARILVTKDTGAEGGLAEKIEAARLEDSLVLIIRRPPEPVGAFYDLDGALAQLRKVLKG